MTPRACVIMRCRNSQDTIAQALAALFSQDFRDFELLVVDSGSTDRTLEIVREFPHRLIQVEPGSYFPGIILNMAAERTASEVLVFQNSDTVPLVPQALGRLIAALDGPGVVAAFARQIPRPDAKPWVRDDYARSFPEAGPAPPWITLSLPLAAMRRTAWEEHRFYTAAWASEDTEWGCWAQRRGYVVKYVSAAPVMHSHNYTLRQLHGRRFVEGEADAFIYRRTQSLARTCAELLRSVARDVWLHLRCVAPLELLATLPRRAVYHLAYHRGHRLGEARIARGDRSAALGQSVALACHPGRAP